MVGVIVVTPVRSELPRTWTGSRSPRRSRPRIGLAPESTQSGGGSASGSFTGLGVIVARRRCAGRRLDSYVHGLPGCRDARSKSTDR